MKESTLLTHCKDVFRFAVPISSGLLTNMFGNFLAMMMVAILGEMELAAASLSITTYMTVMTVVSTIFYAVGILISHSRSQDNSHQQIGLIVKNSFWLALFLMLPSGFVLWNLDKILLLFQQDPNLILIAKSYFHYAALSMIPTLLMSVIGQFYNGIGKPRFTLITALMNLPIMLSLSYSLVLGHFGLPQLGLAGVSLSMFISQSIVCALMMSYLIVAGYAKNYHLFSEPKAPQLNMCKKILRFGVPIGMQSGAELAAMSVAMYFMGFCGVTALAATQVISQYVLLIVMMLIGLSQGLSIMASKAYGEKNINEIFHYLKASMILLGIISMVVLLIFALGSHYLTVFFVNAATANNPEFMTLTSALFIVAAFMLFLDGVRNLLTGLLRALHDSKSPMLINISCLWFISLPVSYFVAFNLNGGPIGLRIAFLSGFICSILLLLRRISKMNINL